MSGERAPAGGGDAAGRAPSSAASGAGLGRGGGLDLDPEEGRELYVSGALLMRDKNYREARASLDRALAIFHGLGLAREERLAVAQLRQLDLVESWELGGLPDRTSYGPGAREDALFKKMAAEITQELSRKSTEATLEEERRRRRKAEKALEKPVKTQAETLARQRASRRSKGSRAETAASQPKPADDGVAAALLADRDLLSKEALALVERGRQGVQGVSGGVEEGRALLLEAADRYAKAGMLREAGEARAEAESAGNILRAMADVSSARAGAMLGKPGAPLVSELQAAEVLLKRGGELYHSAGDDREGALQVKRWEAVHGMVAAEGGLQRGRGLLEKGLYGKAFYELLFAEAQLEAALEAEADYWLDGRGGQGESGDSIPVASETEQIQ